MNKLESRVDDALAFVREMAGLLVECKVCISKFKGTTLSEYERVDKLIERLDKLLEVE